MRQTINFLRRIVSLSLKKVTIILWRGPSYLEKDTFVIVPRKLLKLVAGALAATFVMSFILFLLSPLGSLSTNSEQKLRQEIFKIYDRLESLADSLHASELQLAMFKQALATGNDTLFARNYDHLDFQGIVNQESVLSSLRDYTGTSISPGGLSAAEVIFSNDFFFTRSLEFPVQFPLSGSISRPFESKYGHFGVDIVADRGTPIQAFADGVVLFSGLSLNYGHVVIIQHNDGYVSQYKHVGNSFVKKGDFIRRGNLLGYVGSDGLLSTGPHLHFELWRFGNAVDPVKYFVNFR